MQKLMFSSRWSRREEAEFYKTVSTFGVEFHKPTGRYRWDRFRCFARLDKKMDDTLVEYFHAFYHMCQRVCGKFKPGDVKPLPSVYVEPITEERASRCLARIDLLNKIREEILVNSKIDEHVKQCQASFDMPSWWQCGKHDKELLIGAARHGVARTDYYILRDPTLSFHEMLQAKNMRQNQNMYNLGECPSPSPSDPPLENRPNSEEDKKSAGLKNGDTVKEESKIDKCNKGVKDVHRDKGDRSNTSDSKENGDLVTESKTVHKGKNGVVNDDDETVKDINKKVKVEKTDACSSDNESVVKEELVDKGEKSEDDQDESNKGDKNDSESVCANSAVKQEVKVKSDDLDDPVKVEKDEKDDGKVKKESVTNDTSDGNTTLEDSAGEESRVKVESVKDEGFTEVRSRHGGRKEDPRDLVKEKVQGIINDVKAEKKMELKMEEELMKDNLPPFFSQLNEDSMYMDDGPEPGEIYSGRSVLGTVVDWPKDRVIFHRLEHICFTVENGEWPFAHRNAPPYFGPSGFDSRSGTPVGSSTPKGDSFMDSDPGDSLQETPVLSSQQQVMKLSADNDKDLESDGLKMTFHKRGRGRKRRYEIDSERGAESKLLAARVQQLLNQSTQGTASNPSSDNESQPEAMNLSGASPVVMPSESFLNGSGVPELDPSQLAASLIEQGLLPEKRRRGRKRRAEKMAEVALAEAIAKRHQARILASIDPDGHIPVICLEDGSRLSGDGAPKKKNLESWLITHPNYIIDQSEFTNDEEPGEILHHLPSMITGAKAPPLKHLAEWLEQNPAYDVESKWSELVRTKGALPKEMDVRLLKPSGRGRKPRESMLHPSFLGGDLGYPGLSMAAMGAFSGAGLMGGYPKMPLNLPFGGIPGLGLGNPMLGLAGFGLPGMPMPTLGKPETETKDEKSSDKRDRRKGDSKRSLSPAVSSTPHPSFPSAMYYNPLLYNPMLAAQGLHNFPLPSSLPEGFPFMGQVVGMNGRNESEEEEEMPVLPVAKKVNNNQDRAEDLSVRKKSSGGDSSSRHSSGHHKKHNTPNSEKPKPSSIQEHATDLSLKSKPSSKHRDDKNRKIISKTKIQGSSKLSKIVDTLKDKVMKIDNKYDKKSVASRDSGKSNASRSEKPVAEKVESKDKTAVKTHDKKIESSPAAAVKKDAVVTDEDTVDKS